MQRLAMIYAELVDISGGLLATPDADALLAMLRDEYIAIERDAWEAGRAGQPMPTSAPDPLPVESLAESVQASTHRFGQTVLQETITQMKRAHAALLDALDEAIADGRARTH